MAHVRRAGLVVGMGLLGGLALISSDGLGAAPDPRLLVTVGDVRSDAAVVWAGLAAPGPVTVDVGPVGASARQRLTGLATAETGSTVKLSVAGLAPATLYEYRVTARGEEVTGAFTTAPPPETAAPVRLLWSGDLGGGGRCRSSVDGYPIFRAMAARHPDFFLFVGDTIYADLRCPVPENVPGADFHARGLAGFRAKHRYNRADPQVQAFLRTTSVYAIWDDHEVTNNFAGPSEPLMPAGRQALLEYWPILPPPEDPTRLYRRARWGPARRAVHS